ncbi:PREDICTED: uncharacterized protein LOC108561898 [Nicrophorus vespilloides]|uniref:Uncharacterized protein LOC108561898 n=1 Tax=Nicrophorus vespilloides TaxID=110193 RepID=A0ABM1MLQ2_NICVS|nr:PREDICTED: uncharacterized protein LOC108561898 [Nicrophorus vespilloides]
MHTLRILVLTLFFATAFGFNFGQNSVFGTIKSGLEKAGKMLGLDRASGVAQLVSNAFSKNSRKGETNQKDTIFSGFLRILGLDNKRIGAIAVNAIIFMAQLISTSLSKAPPAYITSQRRDLDESPLDWMLSNPEVEKMLPHASNGNLPHHIVEFLREGPARDSTGCLQLLICKGAPFVWGMQRAINAKGKDVKRGFSALTDYIPSLEQVAEHGDECEIKHPYCIINI